MIPLIRRRLYVSRCDLGHLDEICYFFFLAGPPNASSSEQDFMFDLALAFWYVEHSKNMCFLTVSSQRHVSNLGSGFLHIRCECLRMRALVACTVFSCLVSFMIESGHFLVDGLIYSSLFNHYTWL